MGIVVDDESDPPRVIYTPDGQGVGLPTGLTRLVYDSTAEPDKRWTAEFSFLYLPDESLEYVQASLAI